MKEMHLLYNMFGEYILVNHRNKGNVKQRFYVGENNIQEVKKTLSSLVDFTRKSILYLDKDIPDNDKSNLVKFFSKSKKIKLKY